MTRKKEMITKRILKSTLALALAGAMLFGSFQIPGDNKTLTIGTQTAYAADPLQILCQQEIWENHFDTIRNNLAALQSSVVNLAPADKNIIQSLQAGFAPFISAGGVYNTVTMVLTLTGLMKDPTATKLANISSTLQGMTATLTSMNARLTEMAGHLDSVEFMLKDMNRGLTTQNMADKADGFYTNYVKPLEDLMDAYEDIINEAFRIWFSGTDKDAISIDQYGICIQKDQVASAMQGTIFDINGYRNTIIQAFARKILNLADAKTLTADKNFYASWKSMSEEEKHAEANLLAEECYNTLAGQISCQEMNTHVTFVTNVCAAFKHYCDQLNKDNSPLDAQLKVLYLTHAFEGEIRKDIENVLDTTEVVTGTFASMALSLLDQCKMQPQSRVNELLNNWTNVTQRIATTRDKAIKNYDNYCYMTDSLLVYADRDLNYENQMCNVESYEHVTTTNGYWADFYKTAGLLQDEDKIVGPAEMAMLYKMYSENAKDTGSFYNFLSMEGVGTSETANKKLVTKFDGWFDFSASDGVYMNYGKGATQGGRDYWGNCFETTVNKGNKKGVDNQYFKNCKKATGTMFNPETGISQNNQILGAMAAYAEGYWYWVKDEMYIMGKADECDSTYVYYINYMKHYLVDTNRYTSHYAVLLEIPVPDKPASVYADPLEAFDECQVTKDIQDTESAVYIEESHTDVNPNPEKNIPEEEIEVQTEETDLQPEESGTQQEEAVTPENQQTEVEAPGTDTEAQIAPAEAHVCPEALVDLPGC